jgi:hypothetical protein
MDFYRMNYGSLGREMLEDEERDGQTKYKMGTEQTERVQAVYDDSE